MKSKKVLAIIMAGGKGSRLHPLTSHRSKAAVLFGGKYRLIDFVLSNFINSGIYAIYVLTQFKAQSLLNHIKEGWQFGSLLADHFIIPVPAQMQNGDKWYLGTADAIYQNINLIEDFSPDLVAIFGADHVYRMDIQQMINFHLEKNAKVTVAVNPVPCAEANSFGIVEVDRDYRIVHFEEKPTSPRCMLDNPHLALASMGNYIFDAGFLAQELNRDAQRESEHDFGKAVLPSLIGKEVYAYNYQTNKIPGENNGRPNYWKDVGTIESYYEANMELRSVYPWFNLYNKKWPLKTVSYSDPPAKFVVDHLGTHGEAFNSIISEGCIVSGGKVFNSVLGRNVFVDSQSLIEDSIVSSQVQIGKGAKIKNAIIDKNVRLPEGIQIGYRLEDDRKKFHVSDSGIVVIPKGHKF